MTFKCSKCSRKFRDQHNLKRHVDTRRCLTNRVKKTNKIDRGMAKSGNLKRRVFNEARDFVLHLKANLRRQARDTAAGLTGFVYYSPLAAGYDLRAGDTHGMALALRKGRPKKIELFAGAVLSARFWTIDAARLIGAPALPLTARYLKALRGKLVAHAKKGGQLYNVSIEYCSRQSLLSDPDPDVLEERVDDLVESLVAAARNLPKAYEHCCAGRMEEMIELMNATLSYTRTLRNTL